MTSFSVFYVLDEQRRPVPVDVQTWGAWFEDIGNRRVAYTEVGDCIVSTVFVGLDHNFSRTGRPVLFETMAFGLDELDRLTERSCTWNEAEATHHRVCGQVEAMVRAAEAECRRVLP